MLQNYPVNLIPDENGTVIACFPDVPEAMTVGADEADALEWAQDALVVALSSYMEDRRDIPEPSFPENGQKIVSLPSPFAVKLKIYQAAQHQIIKEAA